MFPPPVLVPARAHLGEAGAAGEAAALSGAHPPPGPVQAALRGAACAADQYGLRAAELLFTPKGLVWMKGGGAREFTESQSRALLGISLRLCDASLFMWREKRGDSGRGSAFPTAHAPAPGENRLVFLYLWLLRKEAMMGPGYPCVPRHLGLALPACGKLVQGHSPCCRLSQHALCPSAIGEDKDPDSITPFQALAPMRYTILFPEAGCTWLSVNISLLG